MYSNLIKANYSKKLLPSLKRLISIESSKSSQLNHENGTLTYRENFAARHIGVNNKEEAEMLKILNVKV